MKKIIALLIGAILIFSFGGCQKQDTFDVKIHIPSGSKISDELYTGSWFVIEKWTQKDGWKEVKYNTIEEIAWTEEARVVPPE